MATPPVFSAGSVLTAGQMNAVGLWQITPSSATNGTVNSDGSVTIGTSVASVTLSGVFSSDYDNYLILGAGGSCPTAHGLRMTLGSTTTGYYYGGRYFAWDGSTGGINNANTNGFWLSGVIYPNGLSMNCHVLSPNKADETQYMASYLGLSTGADYAVVGGFLNNTTQYTAFTLTFGTGTQSGGVIRVYGYNN